MNNEESKINGLENTQTENEEPMADNEGLYEEKADVTAADDVEAIGVGNAAEKEPLLEEVNGIAEDAAEDEQESDFSEGNEEQLLENEEVDFLIPEHFPMSVCISAHSGPYNVGLAYLKKYDRIK